MYIQDILALSLLYPSCSHKSRVHPGHSDAGLGYLKEVLAILKEIAGIQIIHVAITIYESHHRQSVDISVVVQQQFTVVLGRLGNHSLVSWVRLRFLVALILDNMLLIALVVLPNRFAKSMTLC